MEATIQHDTDGVPTPTGLIKAAALRERQQPQPPEAGWAKPAEEEPKTKRFQLTRFVQHSAATEIGPASHQWSPDGWKSSLLYAWESSQLVPEADADIVASASQRAALHRI
jgi:hypothetical protein